jgi:hypothetical protein
VSLICLLEVTVTYVTASPRTATCSDCQKKALAPRSTTAATLCPRVACPRVAVDIATAIHRSFGLCPSPVQPWVRVPWAPSTIVRCRAAPICMSHAPAPKPPSRTRSQRALVFPGRVCMFWVVGELAGSAWVAASYAIGGRLRTRGNGATRAGSGTETASVSGMSRCL